LRTLRTPRTLSRLFALAALAVMLSCGGSSSSSTAPTAGCTPSTAANTFVIQNNQVCPQAMTVTRGSQVTMINSDSRVHEMDSDPHPEHNDCPELNQIGFLNPGQSRLSGNLNIARKCGFHDHGNPDNTGLRGTITIQ
jgi:plastocyanin